MISAIRTPAAAEVSMRISNSAVAQDFSPAGETPFVAQDFSPARETPFVAQDFSRARETLRSESKTPYKTKRPEGDSPPGPGSIRVGRKTQEIIRWSQGCC